MKFDRSKEQHNIFSKDDILIYDRLQIETCSICNHKCIHCASPLLKSNEYMSMELFNKIVHEGTDFGYRFMGLNPLLGDPLLDPYFLDRIETFESTEKLHNYYFFTNLSSNIDNLLHTLKNTNKLNYLAISVYGLDESEFKKITRVNLFKQFIENLNRLKAFLKSKQINLYIPIYTSEKNKLNVYKSKVYQEIFEISKLTPTQYFVKQADQNWAGVIFDINRIPINGPCYNLLSKHKVMIDGSIRACGCFDTTNESAIGNLNTMTFDEIYNKNNILLKNVYSGNLEICKKCTTYKSVYSDHFSNSNDNLIRELLININTMFSYSKECI